MLETGGHWNIIMRVSGLTSRGASRYESPGGPKGHAFQTHAAAWNERDRISGLLLDEGRSDSIRAAARVAHSRLQAGIEYTNRPAAARFVREHGAAAKTIGRSARFRPAAAARLARHPLQERRQNSRFL